MGRITKHFRAVYEDNLEHICGRSEQTSMIDLKRSIWRYRDEDCAVIKEDFNGDFRADF